MFEFPCGLPSHVAISTSETEPARIWHWFLSCVLCFKLPTVYGVMFATARWTKRCIVRFVPVLTTPKSSVASRLEIVSSQQPLEAECSR